MTDPSPRAHTFTTSGGLRLAADLWGDEAAPPVLLLHGGGQTRHAWGETARALARHGLLAVTLDLRGHGDSDRAPDGQYRLNDFMRDVADAVCSFATPPALVGASLGGLVGLLLAGETATPLRSLVLVDVALRVQDAGVERILAFMGAHRDGFDSLEDAAAAVSAYLPDRGRPLRPQGLRKNLRPVDGRWVWHWDPRLLGTLDLSEVRDEARLRRAAAGLHIPLLLVRGRHSDVVTGDIAGELLSAVPGARLAEVAGAGHMVSGDENDAFTQAVLSFLAAQG